MALANVALTDTFDYWRTVTNSMVVALNDKLVYCNTSNANIVSIPSVISRASNLTLDILTSTSVSDFATSNVASAYTANAVNQLAMTYAAAANSNTQISVKGANTYANLVGSMGNNWANTVGTAGNNYASILASNNAIGANNWANSIAIAGNSVINQANNFGIVTYAPKISPTFTGTITINANIANQTLTDGATINWNTALGSVATVTLGGNRVIAAPTNLKVGTYILHIIQDISGNRTVTWNSIFKWPAGVAPVLTTTGSRRDLFSFVCDGTNLYGSYLPDVR
jgi:hypothetical protein